MTLHVPGSNFSHYIHELAPKMRYKVIMQAISAAGSGIRSEPVFSIVRPQECKCQLSECIITYVYNKYFFARPHF